MPKQKLDEASFFFGYTPGVIECLDVCRRILYLTQHSIQFLADHDTRIAMKMDGGTFHITPAEVEVLPHFPICEENPFWCVFSTEQTFEEVSAFVGSQIHPILHISNVRDGRVVHIDEISSEIILQYCHRVIRFFADKSIMGLSQFFRDLPQKYTFSANRRLALRKCSHFLTMVNEITLESNGYSFGRDEKLQGSTTNAPYISAIRASAHAVMRERSRVRKSRGQRFDEPFNLVITAPSFYNYLYTAKLANAPATAVYKTFLSAYRRQNDYMLRFADFQASDLESTEAAFVIHMYRDEIRAYSSAVAVLAGNHFAPVLRLPPAVNLVYEDFKLLGHCARLSTSSPEKSLLKQERLYRRIADRVSKAVPSEFLPDIDKVGNKIKLITNAPIEWLPIRGLPLMLRYEVSRIPTTPGNLTSMHTAMSQELGVGTSAFNQILVVSSYEHTDAIKEILSKAIQAVLPQLDDKIKIKIVDVSDVDAFISAVNKFEGMVMIFDGHGQAALKDVGKILIGGKPVDLLNFRTSLRVPSIVILSSCDTHALDGSHASVANTFLMLGAKTVLGTLLPVDASDAALFACRLILRISEFLPMAVKARQSLRWTSVVSSLQRMVFITEQMTRFCAMRKVAFSREQYTAIQTIANSLTLDDDPDWYEKTIRVAALQFNETEAAMMEELSRCQLVDVIKYIQIGSPDQILILDDENFPEHKDRSG